MAFAVEISLAVARRDTSSVQIRNKQDLYMALTNREMFYAILEQGLDFLLYDKKIFDNASKFEQSQRGNRDKIGKIKVLLTYLHLPVNSRFGYSSLMN